MMNVEEGQEVFGETQKTLGRECCWLTLERMSRHGSVSGLVETLEANVLAAGSDAMTTLWQHGDRVFGSSKKLKWSRCPVAGNIGARLRIAGSIPWCGG